MSKELECLDRIDKRNYLTEREHKEFLGVVEKAIKEYEAIKNAEPTKAMKCLESMYARLPQWDLSRNIDQYNTIKQALKRLESIDNANPSEALKELNAIENNMLYLNDSSYDQDGIMNNINASINTIKQALLKAQESKHYIKWEDLEFKKKSNTIPVRMGDNVYKMTYLLYENEGFIRLEDCQRIYLELFENEKKFFNDLHLERVEE